MSAINQTVDEAFERARRLVRPHIYCGSEIPPDTDNGQSCLTQGLELLYEVANRSHEWRVWWYIGKSHEALAEYLDAYQAFKNGMSCDSADSSVFDEYVVAALRMKKTDLAIIVAEEQGEIRREFPPLFNAALANMVGGNIKRSQFWLEQALNIEPMNARGLELKRRLSGPHRS